MDLAKQFGIQPILLAAQAVNFLVLLFLLQKFLYKPILKVLEQRKNKIAESLKNAEEIEKKLLKTEEDRDKKLAKAATEAQEIIVEATKSASQIIEEAHQKAAGDISILIEQGKETINTERAKMQQEFREEVATIVVKSLQQITGKVLTKSDQEGLINQTLKDIK